MRALALSAVALFLLGITCCLSAYAADAPTKQAAALARMNAADAPAPEAKRPGCPCVNCDCPGCCCGERCEPKAGRLVILIRAPFIRIGIDWRRHWPKPKQ